jgi:hypothetical protein
MLEYYLYSINYYTSIPYVTINTDMAWAQWQVQYADKTKIITQNDVLLDSKLNYNLLIFVRVSLFDDTKGVIRSRQLKKDR